MIEEYTITRDENLNVLIIKICGWIQETWDYSNEEVNEIIGRLQEEGHLKNSKRIILDLRELSNERDAFENLQVKFLKFFRKEWNIEVNEVLQDRVFILYDKNLIKRNSGFFGMFTDFEKLKKRLK